MRERYFTLALTCLVHYFKDVTLNTATEYLTNRAIVAKTVKCRHQSNTLHGRSRQLEGLSNLQINYTHLSFTGNRLLA